MSGEIYCDAGAGSERRRAPRAAIAACMIAGVGILTAPAIRGRFDAHPATPWLGLDITVGVLSCVLSPVLLWRPVGGALGFTVLAALSPAATPAAAMGALQVAQRRGFPVAAAVAATGIAAHAIQGAWQPSRGISFGWWLALITIAYGALVGWGALAQSRRALIASLRERARRAEAEQGRRVAEARMLERNRIAREMHDVLAHRLSLLATYAGALEYRPDSPPERLSRAAGVVRAGVHQALDELREVIDLLREEDHDSGERPQPGLADLPRLVEESRDAGAQVLLRDKVTDPAALPAAAARTAYRVVQEGLTNARKHAAGRPVQVVVEGRPGDRLTIDMRNPLPGDETTLPITPGTGTGLVGLTERVRLTGGRLDHEVAAGEFRLRAWLPWPR
ncbi:sensor histidine kinase [Sphaerimonospora sp. CA-214678]|uniref:sensor histidine kinase n=1 Tax=Sphaerimonospora sp. CA-214678 TaxID=3240029 RepID=UPI003D8A7CE4